MENKLDDADTDVFKKPILLPDKKSVKLESRTSNDEPSSAESANSVETCNQSIVTDEKRVQRSAKASEICKPTKPIPYSEPCWGGQSDIFYYLEVNI